MKKDIPGPTKEQLEGYQEALQNASYIIGADECGYGSWAGSVFACAVLIPRDWRIPKGLNDSKKLTSKQREDLFERLRYKVPYHCESADSTKIDRDGIIVALHRCYRVCLETLLAKQPESLVVIDGEVKISGIKHLHFPQADGIVPAVSAASVIGKVLHDKEMWDLAAKYPGYGFHKSQGYGTKEHKEAIDRLGICPCHRKSYAPIKKALGEDPGEGILIDSECLDVSSNH
jgi:ribonuclease HII